MGSHDRWYAKVSRLGAEADPAEAWTGEASVSARLCTTTLPGAANGLKRLPLFTCPVMSGFRPLWEKPVAFLADDKDPRPGRRPRLEPLTGGSIKVTKEGCDLETAASEFRRQSAATSGVEEIRSSEETPVSTLDASGSLATGIVFSPGNIASVKPSVLFPTTAATTTPTGASAASAASATAATTPSDRVSAASATSVQGARNGSSSVRKSSMSIRKRQGCGFGCGFEPET